MASRFFSRCAVFLLWLIHFLPPVAIAGLGTGIGAVLYRLGRDRRRVTETNLRLCFPEKSEDERRLIGKAHFALLGRAMLDRSLFWWRPPRYLESLITIRGEEKLRELLDQGKPVILFAPHFLGLDAGGVALIMRFDIVSTYSNQKNPIFNELILRGRQRFGNQFLLSRQDGIRATIKAMRAGRPYYYLPDMDFGRRDSVFVPFFNIQTATITGLSRLARAAGATVVPCVTRMHPDRPGYQLEIGDPWDDFPTEDIEADTRRMNAFIEDAIATMPEQYYWVHRRFKTRPAGEPRIY
ncbi:lysophospholipid acyltransferase family protein [Azonexus hydrophilus]|uniref:lysophospholipid acyltransferase family protein n=1 Tax=Azonexus hydrophilus TaxID=418702 RepID=UPI00040B9F0F|nr:lipid A biosynthesis acyltransferase [Azonexus hydrophilus]